MGEKILKSMMQGAFIISLDFEMMWGVLDKRDIENYGANVLEGKRNISKLLALMKKYNIRSSFASVGMLFHKNYEELKKEIPMIKPSYENKAYSNYSYIEKNIITKNNYNKYFSAVDVLSEIKNKGQDIECHTYSHFYCLEEGQTKKEFEADLKIFHKVNKYSNSKAIIFPRNQYSREYLDACYNNGFRVFRGTEKDLFHKTGSQKKEQFWRRSVRFLDSFVNLTGHHCYLPEMECGMINIRASRFFRPPSNFSFLEKFKVNRIKKQMRFAAKHNRIFHLWWHPHNMGSNPSLFLNQLEDIFIYYTYLNEKYNMRSYSLQDYYNHYAI